MYGIDGENLGTYTPTFVASPASLSLTLAQSRVYFFGKKLFMTEDNVGSAASTATFYPYGEQKSGATATEQYTFATYWEDSESGLDYANNRYYTSTLGRFLSPDPYLANNGSPSDPKDPQSWNRYAYAGNDPANFNDPTGQNRMPAGSNVVCRTVYTPFSDVSVSDEGTLVPGGTQYLVSYDCQGPVVSAPSCGSTQDIAFIYDNYKQAVQIASDVDAAFNTTSVTASFVLGWAAAESGYGTNSGALQDNNFYGERQGANWVAGIACPSTANTTWACFNGFAASAFSAFFSPIVMTGYQSANGPVNNPSAGFIIAGQMAAGASIAQALQQVASGGTAGGWNRSQTSYGSDAAGAIDAVQGMINCMKRLGVL